jgi:hypothetical protein
MNIATVPRTLPSCHSPVTIVKNGAAKTIAVNTSGKEYLLANLGFDGIILSNA